MNATSEYEFVVFSFNNFLQQLSTGNKASTFPLNMGMSPTKFRTTDRLEAGRSCIQMSTFDRQVNYFTVIFEFQNGLLSVVAYLADELHLTVNSDAC